MTPQSLRALLEGLIDYAGLFPPAGLEMEPAVHEYVEHLGTDESWMLGRFVVPAARREELLQALPSPEVTLELSVLARAASLREDATALPAGAFEILLPEELVIDEASAAVGIGALRATLESVGLAERPVFLESPAAESIPTVVRGIACAGLEGVGFKLRTGGLEASAFPSSEQVAAALIACRDGGVAFKATAGLHHPVRRWDDGVGTSMHGFFNVFGGAVLALEHGLGEADLVRVLDDEDPASWRFDDEQLAWRGLAVPTASVRKARQTLAVSFGSCSFDEPRDDLRALGLLPTRESPRSNG